MSVGKDGLVQGVGPPLDLEVERRRLLDEIVAAAEPAYRAFTAGILPTALHLYGVRVPDLRGIARVWQSVHPHVARADLLALLDALWEGRSYEERALAMELLGRYRRWIPTLTPAQLDRWRRQLDNWGLTDGLGTAIMGPWIMADPPARLPYLDALIASEAVWSRRLALVATVPINRGRASLPIPDLTLALVDRVQAERDPMITKAVSWALRELTKRHPEQVAAYVAANRERLPAFVVREVGNKLRTGRKNGYPAP
ncbi:MAG: DNA alkylation repair protein [Anaerolineales bacterium]|nr:DNA alkylation repair protein [Anaerolineales bacterium]